MATITNSKAVTMKQADAELSAIGAEWRSANRLLSTAEAKFFQRLTELAKAGAWQSLKEPDKIAEHIVDLWEKSSGAELSKDSRDTKRSEYLVAIKLGTSAVAESGIASMEAVTGIWEKTPKPKRRALYRTKLAIARKFVKEGIDEEMPAKMLAEYVAPVGGGGGGPVEPSKRLASLIKQIKTLLQENKADSDAIAQALAVVERAKFKPAATKATTKKAA